MKLNRVLMRLVSGLTQLPVRWGLRSAGLPRQPLVQLFGIEGGVYCGGLQMHSDTDWEMHPDGDETLTLLSGQIDVILDRGSHEETLHLLPGCSAIVPANIWHRQVVHADSELLFMTPGDTTRHRKRIANE